MERKISTVASLELGFSIHHLASVFIATSLHVLIPQISTPLLQVITPKPFVQSHSMRPVPKRITGSSQPYAYRW